MSKSPLFNAPKGMVWAARDYRGTAHLLPVTDYFDYGEPLCGAEKHLTVISLRVGGASEQPCMECVAKIWNETVRP